MEAQELTGRRALILTGAREGKTIPQLTQTCAWCAARGIEVTGQTMGALSAASAVTTGEVDLVVIDKDEFDAMPYLARSDGAPSRSPVIAELLDALGPEHESALIITD